MKKAGVLLILDGWGWGRSWGGNAITIGQSPNFNKLLREYPFAIIKASGNDVGLPGHEVGNSEVGHMNIGAGEIVEQDIAQINKSIKDDSFYKNEVLVSAVKASKDKGTALHLMGIVSDGGIHSHIVHLLALMKLAASIGHKEVYIHAFTDGRDTDPYKGLEFVEKIMRASEALGTGKIATIIGRAYLDRKGNWEKTKIVYDALVSGVGEEAQNALSSISAKYKLGESDEFIKPLIFDKKGLIKDSDAVIFFNFRSDRTRQITQALLDPNFNKFKTQKFANLDYITFIPYGIERELNLNARPAFPTVVIPNTIGKFIAEKHLKQFHIAETEKYAHVTFFINGNIEVPYPGEDRVLVPSPNVKSYTEKPEMSIDEVTKDLIKNINRNDHNFYICNFANGDMVGHTGDFKAAIAAVQAVDRCVKQVVQTCVDSDIPLIVTADHGNIEQMVDPLSGQPDTEHTRNPVPLILVSDMQKIELIPNGRLSNIASTLLEAVGFEKSELFSNSLIKRLI
jgi:2,3-bisphosphoglycerate-independent phosphoglycerate mutase